MWNLLGDKCNGKPGTYYYSGSKLMEYFWHMFDQVLIRPALIGDFAFDKLKIIESSGNISLLAENGLPDKKFSDHLPIFFSLEPTKGDFIYGKPMA